MAEKEIRILDEINEFNVAGRYEEYKLKMYKKATSKYTAEMLNKGKELYKKLSKQLDLL